MLLEFPSWFTPPPDYEPPPPPPGEVDPPPTDPGDDGGTTGGGSLPYISQNGVRNFVSVNEAASNGLAAARYNMTAMRYDGNTSLYLVRKRVIVYEDGDTVNPAYYTLNGNTTSTWGTWNSYDNGQGDFYLNCDDNQYSWRARLNIDTTGSPVINGYLFYFKTHAQTAVLNTPTISSISYNEAYLQCTFYPKTKHSVATAQLQYKRAVDSTWINAGSSAQTNGYSLVTIGRGVTGLQPSTQYHVRLVVTRTTINATSATSATASFTTTAGVPMATTDAASSINADGGTLNATVNPNDQSCQVSFEWDTDSGAPYANTTSPTQAESGSGDRAVSKSISGAGALATVYFRVKVTYSGGTVYGSEQSFQTLDNPSLYAEDQEMLPIQDFDRKFNVDTKVFFVVPVDASTGSDTFYTAGVVWTAGEVKITKVTYNDTDTPTVSGPTNTTNVPVQVSGNIYSLILTAAEMSCDEAFITISNAGTAVRDILLRIRTRQQISQLDIDALTGTKADTTALLARGYGSGHGISGVGGSTGLDIDGIMSEMTLRKGTAQAGGAGTVTLDTGASGTDDYYNDTIVMIVGGTGVGQARVIIDYTGSTKVASVDSNWSTNPDATSVFLIIPGPRVWQTARGELSSFPADNASYGDKLQLVFQRFFFKIDQTATVQQLYKANNTTVLGSRSVADAAGTQTLGKTS